jgi:hypothetical protein
LELSRSWRSEQVRKDAPGPIEVTRIEQVDRALNAYRGLTAELTAIVRNCTVGALRCTLGNILGTAFQAVFTVLHFGAPISIWPSKPRVRWFESVPEMVDESSALASRLPR